MRSFLLTKRNIVVFWRSTSSLHPKKGSTNMPGLGLSCSPSLSLSLGHRQRQCHRLSQRPALTLEQRQEQRLKQTQEHLLWSNHHLMNFLRFASFVCSRQFVPGATCIECNHALSLAEVLVGFRNDPADVTTACPKCKTRFEATSLLDKRSGEGVVFMCSLQVLERLPGLEKLEPKEIERKHGEVYFSAIFHFGSLLHAFNRKGIVYRREQFDWRDKTKNFLGQVPDKDLARVFGVEPREVSAYRRSQGIREFTERKSILPANWKPGRN